jgi:hypothetical protein
MNITYYILTTSKMDDIDELLVTLLAVFIITQYLRNPLEINESEGRNPT